MIGTIVRGGNVPKSHQRIYGSEAGCDVVFLAGQEHGEPWRLPAHTSILKSKNTLFEIMFSGRFEEQSTVNVPDVDGRAFDNLLRFLYEEPVSVQSVETALGTLYAGHKYLCHGLVRLCVAYLLDNFKNTNVLMILKCIQVFNGDYQNLENLRKERQMTTIIPESANSDNRQSPTRDFREFDEASHSHIDRLQQFNTSESKPVALASRMRPGAITIANVPTDFHNLDYNCTNSIENECSMLLQNCLSYIDQHARSIISSDEMEDLDLCTLRMILSRDTLNVGNDEGIVFTAITKWADKECKRKQLPLTGISKRQVLDESLYLPRYLTMNLKTFQNGPARSDLFTKEEIALLSELIGCCALTNSTSMTTSSIFSILRSSSSSFTPFLHSISKPRRLRNEDAPTTSSSSSQQSPSKRIHCKSKSFFKNAQLRTRRFCCRFTSSAKSTPCSSSNSSPVHNQTTNYNGPVGQNYVTDESQKPVQRKNIFERIVVCLACLLD